MKAKDKSPTICESIDFGIFPGVCLFVYNVSYDKIRAKLLKDKHYDWAAGISGDKELIDSENWRALYREVYNGRRKESRHLFFIFIKDKFKFNDFDYARLAHECLHIVQFYLTSNGPFDRNKEFEAEAYLHTHLMTQCLDAIRRAK